MILYLLVAFPIFLGLLWNKITKKEKTSTSDIFVNGYFFMMAVFMVVAVPAIRQGLDLSQLARIWLIISGIISGVSLLLCWREGIIWLKQIGIFIRKSRKMTKVVAGCFVAATLMTVFFVKPHVDDYTVSIVDTAVDTDRMYGYHPYTGDAYAVPPVMNVNAPIEMLYAVVVCLSGVSASILIQFLLPVILQAWFFLIYWRIGSLLFEEEEERVGVFLLVSGILHWLPVCTEKIGLAVGIFQNPWNGQTLLGCCVLPGIFYQCLFILKKCKSGMAGKGLELVKQSCLLVVMCLSAQLAYIRGAYYAGIMLGLFVVIAVVGKGILGYGITLKDY